MRFCEWGPVYSEILEDFGFDRADDEMCVRVLKAVTVNSDLITEDELADRIGPVSTVFGNAPCLEDDISARAPEGTLIASGSSVGRLMSMGISPDIVVTDLDGDLGPQLEASARGAVTLIHAHGDNQDLVRVHASSFRGPVVLTTQSSPESTVSDFGGFTDGDRAVCLAREFGSKRVVLLGFDYDHPMDKEGSDPDVKLRKLRWARRIIEDMNPPDVVLEKQSRIPYYLYRMPVSGTWGDR